MRKFHIARIPVWLLIFLCVRHANAGQHKDKPAPQHAIGTKRMVKGLPNFGEVTPNLYRGAQPSAEGMEALKKMGVEVVVDLRGRASKNEKAAAERLGMQYVSIPSHCPFPKDEPLVRFLKVMRENRGKKVFVHCRLGDDRTGMAVAAYRMSEQGWSADEALAEMKAFGFSTLHQAMCPGLEGYEKGFPKRLREDPAFQKLSPPASAPK
jgi:tyrosine-protein phosphatase SIW14